MQIHWRNPAPIPEEERDATEKRLQKVVGDHTDVVDVWIDVGEDRHHRKGSGHVTIRGDVRRAALIAIGDNQDVSLSLRDAMRAFEKQLHRLRERRNARPASAKRAVPAR